MLCILNYIDPLRGSLPAKTGAGRGPGGRQGGGGRTAERIVIYRTDFCESVPSRDPGLIIDFIVN